MWHHRGGGGSLSEMASYWRWVVNTSHPFPISWSRLPTPPKDAAPGGQVFVSGPLLEGQEPCNIFGQLQVARKLIHWRRPQIRWGQREGGDNCQREGGRYLKASRGCGNRLRFNRPGQKGMLLVLQTQSGMQGWLCVLGPSQYKDSPLKIGIFGVPALLAMGVCKGTTRQILSLQGGVKSWKPHPALRGGGQGGGGGVRPSVIRSLV